MTNPEKAASKNTNKPFWIFIIIAAAAVLALTVTITAFGLNNASNPDGSSSSSPQNLNQLQTSPPEISSVEADISNSVVNFTIQTEEFDAKKYKLQYEIANQNREIVESGTERGASFTSKTKDTGSGFYRVKVKLQDSENSDLTSKWSDAYTLNLKDVKGVQMLEPAQAFFETPWANGEGGLDNLIQSVEIAYDAYYTEDARACIPLNSSPVTPTLLLPPSPAVKQENATLAFTVSNWQSNLNEGTVAYYWC